MTLNRRLLLCLACVGLSATLAAQSKAPARAIVTIAHFNDVYEIGPVEGGKSGGLARVATAIKQLRRGGAPVVVTLGGDYLSPSALGTARVNGERLAGRQMVDVLNAVGLQWATLGNHEFDVPEAAFRTRMAESTFGVVISSVTDASGQPFPHTVDTAIVPVKAGARTVRIGLIGLVGDFNKAPYVRYQPVIASATRAVGLLAGQVDAIVALTHLSLADDAALAVAVPEIDVILGGHEHENWVMRRGERFTPIVKADANVRSMAVVDLAFGAAGTRPTVSSRLQLITSAIAPDPAVDALVTKWTTTAFDAFRRDGFTPERTVVTLTEPLDGREAVVRNREGRLTQIIANAMRRDADAEVGLFNGGSIRIDDVLTPGPLTEYDIIRILPFGGKVVKATFDGALLAKVLDQGLGNQGAGGFLHSSDGTIRTSAGWVINGEPLDPARRYTVGTSDFLLTGGEVNLGYLTRTNPAVHDLQDLRDVRLAVIDELKRRYR